MQYSRKFLTDFKVFGTGITLTNNEIKDIMNENKSLRKYRNFNKRNYQKIYQLRRILYFLQPLMTAGLPLFENVLTTLAKTVLIPLGLTAATSATDTAIQKEIFDGSGTTALIISEIL